MRVKTKFSMLALLLTLALSVSCQEENINIQDTKADIGKQENGKYIKKGIVLTSDNYITEHTLYLSFLYQKLTSIKDEKSALLKKLQKGDKKAEIILNQLILEEKEISITLKDILDFGNLYEFKPKPNPCPRPVTCFPKDFKYLVKLDSDKMVSFNVYSKKGSLVGEKVSDDISLSNQKLLNAIEISMSGYVGEGYVKISRIDGKGNQTSYSVDVDIQ